MKSLEDYKNLSHQILGISNQEISRIEFLHELTQRLLIFSRCNSIDFIFHEGDKFFCTYLSSSSKHAFKYENFPVYISESGEKIPRFKEQTHTGFLIHRIIQKKYEDIFEFISRGGSFYTGNMKANWTSVFGNGQCLDNNSNNELKDSKTIAIIPIIRGMETVGAILFKSHQEDFLNSNDIIFFEDVAKNLSIALTNHRTKAALHERVKELTCLYQITQISEQLNISLDQILSSIVELIPPAWQYPDITEGRIILDGRIYITSNFSDIWQRQISDIIINGKIRGSVEVVYTSTKPTLDEGPFLKEERHLLDTLAVQLAQIVERKESEEQRLALQEQLRHADRLSIIGQLAAGVAHELNEPLGSILGFAQLAKKSNDFPQQAEQDISKIIKASLYARDIIKKLMVFARDVPTETEEINLNKTIDDGLFFLESRCTKSDIRIIKKLQEDLPNIISNHSQINQILINLVVNSIQAMPYGGELIISTVKNDIYVSLIVEDTGIGMSEDTKNKIFLPFFTTKDINEGTGLGLAVVHGIVSSHGGKIEVQSMIDKGTKIEIKFPVC